MLAGMERDQVPEPQLRSSSVTDTDELLADAGYDARRDRRPAREGNRRVTDVAGGLPPEIEALIGKVQYEEIAEFPVERSYVWTTCASVENGNPLYWDDAVAEELTGGPTAPPTMLSVWFRVHRWTPWRHEEGLSLQVHFDLKEKLGLPEAIIADNTMTFYEPVRPGDILRTHQILRSISDEKTTKLGTGRFWNFDVETFNQRDELVGVDTYTSFGYRRPNS